MKRTSLLNAQAFIDCIISSVSMLFQPCHQIKSRRYSFNLLFCCGAIILIQISIMSNYKMSNIFKLVCYSFLSFFVFVSFQHASKCCISEFVVADHCIYVWQHGMWQLLKGGLKLHLQRKLLMRLTFLAQLAQHSAWRLL